MSTKNKIIPLSEASHKHNVVLCHGVFDLIHASHVDYFEKSKEYGDTLIVSITDDKYVNKGLNRPHFNISHRCKIVSSFDCVDYVVVSPEPSAKTVIDTIKPKFYTKGIEYKDRVSLTGKINIEKDAVKLHGGNIIYIKTDEIMSSSSIINNQTFTPELLNTINLIKKHYTLDHIYTVINSLKNIEIVLIGETIIDKYIYGDVIGTSSKYPCMVFKEEEEKTYEGGIIAVAKQLAGFVRHVDVITYIGDDNYTFNDTPSNIDIHNIIKENSPTIIKQRYIDRYYQSRLFETYTMNDRPLNNTERKQLNELLQSVQLETNPRIGINYGHGFLNGDEALLSINAQSNAGNKGYNYIGYHKDVDHMVLDEQEMRLECCNKYKSIVELNEYFIRKNSYILTVTTTVGSKGCIITQKDLSSHHIPAIGGEVKDTVGAGDAFFGLFSCLLHMQIPLVLTGFLSNIAGFLTANIIGHESQYNPIQLKQTLNSLMK